MESISQQRDMGFWRENRILEREGMELKEWRKGKEGRWKKI